MSTQSSLTPATGSGGTSAWADLVGEHLETTETARPANTHEGKSWIVQTKDRWMADDGASHDIVRGWYTKAGRCGFTIPNSTGQAVNWGTLFINWDTGGAGYQDPDNWCSAFGSRFGSTFTVPTGMDGLYVISFFGTFTAGWNNNQDAIQVIAASKEYWLPVYTLTGVWTCVTQPIDLVAGNTFTVTGWNNSGSAKTLSTATLACWRFSR